MQTTNEAKLRAGVVLWSGNACIYHHDALDCYVVEWPTAPEALAWFDRTYYATFTELQRYAGRLLAEAA